jgi:hypothetical protein
MTAQFADARLVDAGTVGEAYEAGERPVTGFDCADAKRGSWIVVVRGITGDVLIALPFWALIAFVVYLVV